MEGGVDDRSEIQNQATTQKLHVALGSLRPLYARFHALRLLDPQPGSALLEDAQLPLGHLPWVFALQGWANGHEHASTWLHLLESGIQPERSHYTLTRAAIEGAVTCRWLMDPRCGGAEKRTRGIRAQLKDYTYRASFEKHFPAVSRADGSPARSAAERLVQLRSEMAELGIVEVKMPSMTELFADYSLGGWFYSLLSSFAHGQQWSLVTTRRSVVVDMPGIVGARMMRVTADDELTLAAAAQVWNALALALRELEVYAGIGDSAAVSDAT